MPFELANAPATLQEMMNTVFPNMEGCISYLENILIYRGDTENEYQQLVEKVVQQFVWHGLVVNLLKSEFHVRQTQAIFLCHIINGQQIPMDPSKLYTMYKRPRLRQKKDVQVLLGFAKYYSWVINNYSYEATSLIMLTKHEPDSCGYG